MSYIFIIVSCIFLLWFLGKISRPASALAGLFGVAIALIGSVTGHQQATLFGLGLLGVSGIAFLFFNGGKW